MVLFIKKSIAQSMLVLMVPEEARKKPLAALN
jgi:hypothetical protein